MIDRNYKTKICSKCRKEYRIVKIKYPSKLDEDRYSFYCCPYCGNDTEVYLRGNEDIETEK